MADNVAELLALMLEKTKTGELEWEVAGTMGHRAVLASGSDATMFAGLNIAIDGEFVYGMKRDGCANDLALNELFIAARDQCAARAAEKALGGMLMARAVDSAIEEGSA